MRDPHVDEFVDLYALGALEASEQNMVDQHLDECERCRSLLDDSRRVAELLTWTPEQVEPPPDLQRRVMERINQLARTEQRGRQPETSRSTRRPWYALPRTALRLTAALALVEALVLGGLLWQAATARQNAAQLQTEVARLQNESNQLSQTNQQLAAENAQLADAAAELQPLANLLREPGTRLVALLGDANDPQSVRGYVVLSPQDTQGFVTTASLQPLPDEQTYQFWLVDGDVLTSAGTFDTDEQGVGRIAIQGQQPLGDYDAVGISVEPAGGSEQPTEIVLVQPLEG